jgi:hypothetical protein
MPPPKMKSLLVPLEFGFRLGNVLVMPMPAISTSTDNISLFPSNLCIQVNEGANNVVLQIHAARNSHFQPNQCKHNRHFILSILEEPFNVLKGRKSMHQYSEANSFLFIDCKQRNAIYSELFTQALIEREKVVFFFLVS